MEIFNPLGDYNYTKYDQESLSRVGGGGGSGTENYIAKIS